MLGLCLSVYAFCGHAQIRHDMEYDWDTRMENLGLVDVCFWEPSIACHLVYATPDNFMQRPLYNTKLTKAWLHPVAATMLFRALDILKASHPDFSILIYDAARPIEVQRVMSDWAKRTKNDNFFADPAKGGGLHNYGMAVDVTLINKNGEPFSMGTPFDFFGPEAYTDKEEDLLNRGRITRTEYNNRKLLRSVMEAAGFKSIRTEWWHFNACTREEAVVKGLRQIKASSTR